jgi:hypothetical protein
VEGNLALQALNAFRALASDIEFEWNAPFDRVRTALEERRVRSLEAHGFRMLRFEETLTAGFAIDLQYELHFSPDCEYGLRDADTKVEATAGKIDAAGSVEPMVEAFRAILEILRERYGEPQLSRRTTPEELEELVRRIDRTRAPVSAMASWLGPQTHLLHELVGSHTLKQRLRSSPVAEQLLVVNRTGKGGLELTVTFPGGRARETLANGQERVVEMKAFSQAEVAVRLGGSEAKRSVPVRTGAVRVEVRRSWITGRLELREA